MRDRTARLALAWIVWLLAAAPGLAQPGGAGREVSARFQRLTPATPWRLAASLPLQFDAHHPQGMVRIGERFYVSSVEVTEPTQRYAQPREGRDRSAGAGVGHLFVVDAAGRLVTDRRIGEGAAYHPGGMDFDGIHLWVAVAEYRPRSRSIIYRVEPVTLRATEVFRFPDHVGAIVCDAANRTLHGVSWGSRELFQWRLDAQGRLDPEATPPELRRRVNPSFYIDYQDGKFLGRGEMLCAGLRVYRGGFALGGLELIDLEDGRPKHQLPVELWTDAGRPMTQNPFWIEPTREGLRVWFLPGDGRATIYTYDVAVP